MEPSDPRGVEGGLGENLEKLTSAVFNMRAIFQNVLKTVVSSVFLLKLFLERDCYLREDCEELELLELAELAEFRLSCFVSSAETFSSWPGSLICTLWCFLVSFFVFPSFLSFSFVVLFLLLDFFASSFSWSFFVSEFTGLKFTLNSWRIVLYVYR